MSSIIRPKKGFFKDVSFKTEFKDFKFRLKRDSIEKVKKHL